MVGVPVQRRRDHGGVADLEETHLRVLQPVGRLDRVEDVLQLPFLVEHGRGSRLLVRRAHGHQDL